MVWLNKENRQKKVNRWKKCMKKLKLINVER